MTAQNYTETTLPELAYLVAQQGDPALLNAAADFSSYFERDEVHRWGAQLHAERICAHAGAGVHGGDPVAEAAALIAGSDTAFVVKSSAIPELTAMYFSCGDGIAEVILVSGRTVVTTRPPPARARPLLERHLRDDPVTVLVSRHRRDGSELHLVITEGRAACSDDGAAWRAADVSGEEEEALGRFVGEQV